MHVGVFENGKTERKKKTHGHASRDVCCKHLAWILLENHILLETHLELSKVMGVAMVLMGIFPFTPGTS